MSAAMRPYLRHRFVAGLRFDTQARYFGHGGQWRLLPHPEQASNTSRLAVLQALALLTGRWSDSAPPWASGAELVDGLSWRLPERKVWRADGEQALGRLPAIGLAVDLGGLALLRLQLATEPANLARWVLVVGLEEACRKGSFAVRALLVRDGALPLTWSCGHNARLELAQDAQSSAVYRTLDGGVGRVRCVEVVGVS